MKWKSMYSIGWIFYIVSSLLLLLNPEKYDVNILKWHLKCKYGITLK